MKQMLIRDIPDNLHTQFKVLCAKKNISLKAAIRKLIEYAVNRDEIPGKED